MKNRVGQTFGRLTVSKFVGMKNGNAYWLCNCSCGGQTIVCNANIKSAIGCGCADQERIAKFAFRLPQTDYRAALRHVYVNKKSQAKSRGLNFNLTFDRWSELIAQGCHYCGLAASNRYEYRGHTVLYNGVDRVDSGGGYDIDNVVPCCKTCNLGKNDQSLDEFYTWIKRVHQHSATS